MAHEASEDFRNELNLEDDQRKLRSAVVLSNNDDLSAVPLDASDSKEGKDIMRDYIGELKKERIQNSNGQRRSHVDVESRSSQSLFSAGLEHSMKIPARLSLPSDTHAVRELFNGS